MTRHHKRMTRLVLYAMLGTLLFLGKLVMEFLPNIHPVAMLVLTYTVVYRWQALIPLYVYVFLTGLYGGFNLWWVPYLYIWTILWALAMLVPKGIPAKAAAVVYPLLCALHGFGYGALYAPVQALMFGYDFATMCKWIVAGLPFDVLHGCGNAVMGLLVLPLSILLKKLNKTVGL